MRDAVAVFMAMGTQWLWAGGGMGAGLPVGLNYLAITPTAAGLNVKLTPTVFNDIRVLELESLRVWSKRRV